MRAEFDTYAGWTAEAAQSLGARGAVPAACRGSGTPAALSWLLDAIRVRRSEPFLDIGAGLGGPAEFARRERGVRPVCLDPMRQACLGARDLFGLNAIQTDACRIPFADNAFRSGWSLGTLCTTTSRDAWVAEWRRVLCRGARMGVLVLTSTEDTFDIPTGNSFPSLRELDRLWAASDFYPVRQRWASSLPRPDADWTAAEERVARRVADVHATQDLYGVVRQQERAVGELIASGRVRGLLVVVAGAKSSILR